MARLPPASYLRLVDMWLISTQLVPFIEVALMTLIELYQDSDMDINHHGFKRYKDLVKSAKLSLLHPLDTI